MTAIEELAQIDARRAEIVNRRRAIEEERRQAMAPIAEKAKPNEALQQKSQSLLERLRSLTKMWAAGGASEEAVDKLTSDVQKARTLAEEDRARAEIAAEVLQQLATEGNDELQALDAEANRLERRRQVLQRAAVRESAEALAVEYREAIERVRDLYLSIYAHAHVLNTARPVEGAEACAFGWVGQAGAVFMPVPNALAAFAGGPGVFEIGWDGKQFAAELQRLRAEWRAKRIDTI